MIVLSVLCIAVATNTNLKQLLCCSIAIGDAMAICFLFLVSILLIDEGFTSALVFMISIKFGSSSYMVIFCEIFGACSTVPFVHWHCGMILRRINDFGKSWLFRFRIEKLCSDKMRANALNSDKSAVWRNGKKNLCSGFN